VSQKPSIESLWLKCFCDQLCGRIASVAVNIQELCAQLSRWTAEHLAWTQMIFFNFLSRRGLASFDDLREEADWRSCGRLCFGDSVHEFRLMVVDLIIMTSSH